MGARVLWEETGGEGSEDYRCPVQLLMPYNYTLRHAVKCYTNNNIDREQLQSQCKLWRRRVLKPSASEPKIGSIPKTTNKQTNKQKNNKTHI